MTTILHIIDSCGPGGGEEIFSSVIASLDPARFRSIAMIRGGGWLEKRLREAGVTDVVALDGGASGAASFLALLKAIRRYKVDVLHAHMWGANLYACLAGLLCDVRVITTYHGLVEIAADERWKALKMWIARRGATRSVFVSHYLRERYCRLLRLDRRRATTVHNGIPIGAGGRSGEEASKIRNALGLPHGAVVVGALGNIRSAKGYDVLLRAAAALCRTRNDVYFVVAGDTSGRIYPDLIALHASLGLADRFRFCGFIADAMAFIRSLDVFVLSSVSEGFSLSTVMAMAAETPVVATKCGGPEEIIEDAVTGILVEPNDHVALAAAIGRCITADTVRMVRAARSACISRFNRQSMISGYENIYHTVMSGVL